MLHPLHAAFLAMSVGGALAWRFLPPLGPACLFLAMLPLVWPNAPRGLGTLRLILGGMVLLVVVQGPGKVDAPSPFLPHPWEEGPPRIQALLLEELEQPESGLEGLAELQRGALEREDSPTSQCVRGWWRDDKAWHPLPGLLDLWPHRTRSPAWTPGRWHLVSPRQADTLLLEQAVDEVGPFMVSPRHLAWQRGKVGRLRLDSLSQRLLPVGAPAAARPWLARQFSRMREAFARRLLEGSGAGGPWMVAILLGEQRLLPPEEVALWQRSGLAHLLAVSGLNTGVLALALTQVLAPLPLRRRWRDALLILLLLLYVPLAGWQVSVKRAVGMAIVLVLGKALERPQSGMGALALTASGLLWLDPAELGRPGFLLSCGAVAALLLGMGQTDKGAATGQRGGLFRVLQWSLREGLGALRISLVAQLGTVAVLLAFFGSLPLGGLLLNVVAVPLSSVLTVAAFLHLALPLPLEPLGALCAALAGAITWCASHMPLLALEWDLHPLQLTLLSLASCLLLLPLRRLSLIPRVVLAGLCLGVAGDLLPRLARPSAWLCLFNVGQGDAVLLSSPDGEGVLVDTGWENPQGEGGRGLRLAQACSRLLPNPPSWLVLTHPDQDHLGGALAFLQKQAVCSLMWNGEWKENPPQQRLRTWLGRLGPPMVQALPGQMLQAGTHWRVRVLGPSAPSPGVEGNERSIVLRVESRQGAVLITGDAGHAQERWLAPWGSFLAARWIKLGHHGSRGSSSQAFLDQVGAREAWISCGKGNRYGHPHEEVLSRLRAKGLRVHRSDRHGWRWISLDGRLGPRRAMPRPRLRWQEAASRAPPP